MHADVVPELIIGTHFTIVKGGTFHYFERLAHLGILQQFGWCYSCFVIDFG